VVLVLHAPHPEAGGLLGLRKLREHYMSSWENPTWHEALTSFLGAPLSTPTHGVAAGTGGGCPAVGAGGVGGGMTDVDGVWRRGTSKGAHRSVTRLWLVYAGEGGALELNWFVVRVVVFFGCVGRGGCVVLLVQCSEIVLERG